MPGKFIPITIQLNLGNAQVQLQKFGSQVRGIGQSFSSVATPLSLGITAPLTAFGTAAVKAATDLDSLTRGLTAVTGSSVEAERQLVRLKEVAKLPGLGFKEAIEGSINLQAAGFSAESAERSMKAFGNALASVGRGKNELNEVIVNLQQIQSTGKVSGDEIKEIAARVPQLRKAMIDAFGTADTEILGRAKLTSRKFIEGVTRELEKLPKVTGGARNTFENLQDTAQQSLAKIGEPILRNIIPALDRLIPKVEEAANAFGKLSAKEQDTALKLGAVAIAAGPALGMLANLTIFLGGAAKAAGALAGALAGIPAALRLISGVTGVGIGSANPARRLAGLAGGTATAFGGALIQSGDISRTALRQRDEGDARVRQLQRETPQSRELRTRIFSQLAGQQPQRLRDVGSDLDTFRAEERRKQAEAEEKRRVAEEKRLRDQILSAGSGKGGSKKETELQKLAGDIKELNAELKIFGNLSSKEFQLRLEAEGLRKAKSDIEELLELQREAGLQPDLPQLTLRTGKLRDRKGRLTAKDQFTTIFDTAAIQERAARLRGEGLSDITTEQIGGLDTRRELLTTLQEGLLERRGDVLEKQTKIADGLIETTEDLREQLAALQDTSEVGRATRDLKRRGIDLGFEESQAQIAAARQLDEFRERKEAEDKLKDAMEDSRREAERFAQQLRNTFEDVLGSLLRGDLRGAGGTLKNLGAHLGSQFLGNLFNFGGAAGQTGAQAGGGFSLSNLLRTPSFNPSAAGGAGGFKGLLNSALGVSLFKGGATTAAANGAANVLPFVGTALSGTAATASTAATAASQIPGVIGAAGASGTGAGAAAGGLSLAKLGAFFTNPVTAIVAGAAIGGFLLFKFLRRGNYSKDVKAAIKREYGVEVSKDVIKQIELIGKSRYGGDYKKRINETVRLPEVRDLVAQYAEDTGQKGNSKLFNQADLSDPFSRQNFFTNPSPIPNASFVRAQTPTSVGPSGVSVIQAAQIGTNNRLAAAIEMLVGKVQAMELGQILVANSGAVGEAYREDFRNNPANAELIGLSVNP